MDIKEIKEYMSKYQMWLNDDYFDTDTKEELKMIKDNEKEIEDRFYRDLEFGTGGLRGVMGAGTNRMNKYTVRKAAQGMANYILKNYNEDASVVIAYDSRINSKEFSIEAAMCFLANGIKVYRFEDLRPTPELSFAVRWLKCTAGVVITASHNPCEYNGYKVYWADGGQITPPLDKYIIDEVNNIADITNVKTMECEEAYKTGLYHIIGEEVDNEYMKELMKLRLNTESDRVDQDIRINQDIRIVYTPLHGAGNKLVQAVLNKMGYTDVHIVKEQEAPDGRFPTVASPNPEDKRAFKLALKLAGEIGAELVLATDPDADRLGAYVKDTISGEYIELNGNMTGALICEYILEQKKEKGMLPKNGAVINTIVTTNMATAIAKSYGVKLYEVLTGFKYIGEKIKEFDELGNYKYLFGFEESYGSLIGTYARDKDAVAAVMILSEMAAYYKSKGLSLWDKMLQLYDKYGYYKESLLSLTYKGIDGVMKISKLMEKMRINPPSEVSGRKVLKVRDYNTGIITDLITNEKTETGLLKSDVLYFELEEDSWFCARPSGTEPKIKYYFGVKAGSMREADEMLKMMEESVEGTSF